MTTDLPDVNVLVALHFEDHVHHDAALAWFGDGGRFATTAITEIGFVRVAMNPVVIAEPFTAGEAIDALRRLRGLDRAEFWVDDTSLAAFPLATRILAGHRQVTDVHLLGLAASRGGRLVTFDGKGAGPLRPSERRLVHVLPAVGR
jgi:toxin-antitoxin system PIN domain toxin